MIKRKRTAVIASTVLAGVAVLTGCDNGSFKGSGQFPGAHGGTAQAQFKLICDTKTQRVSGALAYADPNVGVLLIGQPTSVGGDWGPVLRDESQRARGQVMQPSIPAPPDCTDNPNGGDYFGTYLSLVTKTTGSFEFALTYTEACESGSGFQAEMWMTSGPYAGYHDQGCLTGGHITPINTGGNPQTS